MQKQQQKITRYVRKQVNQQNETTTTEPGIDQQQQTNDAETKQQQ